MTTPDALTVLKFAADMFAERATYPGHEVRWRLNDLRERLEREQAEAKPVCLHLNVTHATNVVTGGFGGSFCRDCNAKVDQVWRHVK